MSDGEDSGDAKKAHGNVYYDLNLPSRGSHGGVAGEGVAGGEGARALATEPDALDGARMVGQGGEATQGDPLNLTNDASYMRPSERDGFEDSPLGEFHSAPVLKDVSKRASSPTTKPGSKESSMEEIILRNKAREMREKAGARHSQPDPMDDEAYRRLMDTRAKEQFPRLAAVRKAIEESDGEPIFNRGKVAEGKSRMLDEMDRHLIEKLLKLGFKRCKIAQLLGCHVNTICNEIARCGGADNYSAKAAQAARNANIRKRGRKKSVSMDPSIRARLNELLQDKAVYSVREVAEIINDDIRRAAHGDESSPLAKAANLPTMISLKTVYNSMRRGDVSRGNLEKVRTYRRKGRLQDKAGKAGSKNGKNEG